jgi:hypothetical protein
MNIVRRVERIIAWNPAGVMSSRTVAVRSSSPRPTYVSSSGNFAASSGCRIEDFQIENRSDVPPGSGSVSERPSTGASKLSSGAASRTVRISAGSITKNRESSG